MNVNDDVRDDLMKMRDDQLNKLVALASDRKAADSILSKFFSLEKALAAVDPPTQQLEYAKYKRATDAILACLDKAGKPLTQDAITADILEGGFRYGDKLAGWMIGQSIRSFTHGTGRATRLIKIVNGLIGRGDWEDERFVG